MRKFLGLWIVAFACLSFAQGAPEELLALLIVGSWVAVLFLTFRAGT